MKSRLISPAATMMVAMLFWLGLTSGATSVEISADAPESNSVPSMPDVGAPLHCVIQGVATCKTGESPKITVTLTNQTTEAIYLAGCLDASDFKSRFPHCYFEVIGPDGKSSVQAVSRCGMMDPLREKNFVKVLPGKSFDPFKSVDQNGFSSAHQLSRRNFTQTGKYRVRFVYSTANEDIGKWGGVRAENAEIDAKFKQVPKTEVRSAEFILTVEAAQ